jgi:hypothetical protein
MRTYNLVLSFLVSLFFNCGVGAGSFPRVQPYVMGQLMGQFGNQMFVVAAAHSLALDNGARPIFPGFLEEADPVFQLRNNYEKVFYHLDASKPQVEPGFVYYEQAFNYSPIPYKPNMKIVGWFQSEKYFKQHKREILRLFQAPSRIVNYLQSKYEGIIDHPKSVSIHLRTYLKEDPEQKVYCNYGRAYVEKALAQFPDDSLFVVFSNDMKWARKALEGLPRKLLFIEGESYLHDFYLMSMCKHNIITNSSFSWWAAYLNRNPEKRVIAPPEWFAPTYVRDTSDLIPESWMILK